MDLARLAEELHEEQRRPMPALPQGPRRFRPLCCPLCRQSVRLVGSSTQLHVRYRCVDCGVRFNVVRQSLETARDALAEGAGS